MSALNLCFSFGGCFLPPRDKPCNFQKCSFVCHGFLQCSLKGACFLLCFSLPKVEDLALNVVESLARVWLEYSQHSYDPPLDKLHNRPLSRREQVSAQYATMNHIKLGVEARKEVTFIVLYMHPWTRVLSSQRQEAL